MRKAIIAAAVAGLALAAAPTFAQTLPAMPGTGGGYAGAVTGPGSIGGNPDGIMGSPGTDGAWPNGPAGLSSVAGETLTATGSMNGLTGGYPSTTPRGLATLLGIGGG